MALIELPPPAFFKERKNRQTDLLLVKKNELIGIICEKQLTVFFIFSMKLVSLAAGALGERGKEEADVRRETHSETLHRAALQEVVLKAASPSTQSNNPRSAEVKMLLNPQCCQKKKKPSKKRKEIFSFKLLQNKRSNSRISTKTTVICKCSYWMV